MAMELTRRLHGKKVESVMTNGHVLVIRTSDGLELRIAWVDDNGKVLKGMPLCEGVGYRLLAEGMQELITGAMAGLKGLVVPRRRS